MSVSRTQSCPRPSAFGILVLHPDSRPAPALDSSPGPTHMAHPPGLDPTSPSSPLPSTYVGGPHRPPECHLPSPGGTAPSWVPSARSTGRAGKSPAEGRSLALLVLLARFPRHVHHQAQDSHFPFPQDKFVPCFEPLGAPRVSRAPVSLSPSGPRPLQALMETQGSVGFLLEQPAHCRGRGFLLRVCHSVCLAVSTS